MFDVGDKVVCVDARQNPSPWEHALVLGRVYTVSAITSPTWSPLFGDMVPGVMLVELPVPPRGSGYVCARFRKIDRADDEFVEQIRALKPRRVTEAA